MKALHFTKFLLSQPHTYQPSLHHVPNVDEMFPFLDESIGTILASGERKHNRKINDDDDNNNDKGLGIDKPWGDDHYQCFIALELDEKNRIAFRALKNPTATSTTTVQPTTTDETSVTSLSISMSDVVFLAQQCEDFVFGCNCDDDGTLSASPSVPIDYWSPPLQGLIELGTGSSKFSSLGSVDNQTEIPKEHQEEEYDVRSQAMITAATLLAMNGLESAIRKSLGYVTGRAPLLRTMILQIATRSTKSTASTIANDSVTTSTSNDLPSFGNNTVSSARDEIEYSSQKQLLSEILQRLLFPTPIGLNLRNILWHGFVGNQMPRSWLALVVVLTTVLLQDCRQEEHLLNQHDGPTSKRNHSITKNGCNGGNKSSNTDTSAACNGVFSFRSLDDQSLQMIVKRADKIAIGTYKDSAIVDIGDQYLIECCAKIKSWLPSSHRPLFELAIEWAKDGTKPACSTAILTILLEHGLRLDWCRLNQRFDDTKVRPGAFFVTLDGHGQRHIHDLLLYPYLTASMDTSSNSTTTEAAYGPKNELVFYLGGSTIALLTDLFASSCGGPNIRATICHGLYDDYLEDELSDGKSQDVYIHSDSDQHISTSSLQFSHVSHKIIKTDSANCFRLWDMLRVVLVSMEMVASTTNGENGIITKPSWNQATPIYHPVFSYTATTCRILRQATEAFSQLGEVQSTVPYSTALGASKVAFGIIDNAFTDLIGIDELQLYVTKNLGLLLLNLRGEQDQHGASTHTLRSHDVFLEHKVNQQLALCGVATRTLLKDVADVILAHTSSLKASLLDLDDDRVQESDDSCDQNLHSLRRQRRRNLRIVNSTELSLQVTYFAALVAVESLKFELYPDKAVREPNDAADERATILKAVERSRMIVSTVSTFVYTNPDRAHKAVTEYCKGKAIKAIAARVPRE